METSGQYRLLISEFPSSTGRACLAFRIGERGGFIGQTYSFAEPDAICKTTNRFQNKKGGQHPC
ncbi:MAG: hypothetical protein D6681_06825 [Calditrichaeota bacterium]|nr:MAG: hypothetical protein D6681_06825 [Calditrichota bacterium]